MVAAVRVVAAVWVVAAVRVALSLVVIELEADRAAPKLTAAVVATVGVPPALAAGSQIRGRRA
jgi:predicted membrane protein